LKGKIEIDTIVPSAYVRRLTNNSGRYKTPTCLALRTLITHPQLI
jgi:hypothetical protein